jgi:hypothetical protein
MFCPVCESEFREGFTRCNDCDVALVEELFDEQAALGSLVPLIDDISPNLIGEVTERLEKQRIPYMVQAGTALAIIEGDVETLTEPGTWRAHIWVTEDRAQEAHRLLEATRFEMSAAANRDPEDPLGPA